MLATVEHSGSFATLKILGWKIERDDHVVPFEERQRVRPGQILFAHLYDNLIDEIIEYGKHSPVMTTIRPLADIRASWIRRGRNLHELDRQLANRDRLIRECDPYMLTLGRP